MPGLGLADGDGLADLGHRFAAHRPDASTLAIVSWATWRCSSLVG
jgi:hypothetical protein